MRIQQNIKQRYVDDSISPISRAKEAMSTVFCGESNILENLNMMVVALLEADFMFVVVLVNLHGEDL